MFESLNINAMDPKLVPNNHHIWNNGTDSTINVSKAKHELFRQGQIIKDMIHQKHPDYKILHFFGDPMTSTKINPKRWENSL